MQTVVFPLPESHAVIFSEISQGQYHPLNCSAWRGRWCDCGGFLSDQAQYDFSKNEARINRVLNQYFIKVFDSFEATCYTVPEADRYLVLDKALDIRRSLLRTSVYPRDSIQEIGL